MIHLNGLTSLQRRLTNIEGYSVIPLSVDTVGAAGTNTCQIAQPNSVKFSIRAMTNVASLIGPRHTHHAVPLEM